MKRFIVFGGECYYPLGGYSDYIDSFDSKSEAIDFIYKRDEACAWSQLFDDKEKKILYLIWDKGVELDE